MTLRILLPAPPIDPLGRRGRSLWLGADLSPFLLHQTLRLAANPLFLWQTLAAAIFQPMHQKTQTNPLRKCGVSRPLDRPI